MAGQRNPDQPLASKSTLCRLERTAASGAEQGRYQKIRYDAEAIDQLLLDVFLEAHPEAPNQVVLDRSARPWLQPAASGSSSGAWAASAFRLRALYEDLYCARGEMESRTKEQLLLCADRMSAETMRANQLRLYLSAAAYVLVEALRRLALKGTEMAQAQVNTIRLRLLKIGAQIRFTARRVVVSMASGYPCQALFGLAWKALGT